MSLRMLRGSTRDEFGNPCIYHVLPQTSSPQKKHPHTTVKSNLKESENQQ